MKKIFKKFFIIFLCANSLLSSCKPNKEVSEDNEVYINAEITGYVKEFKAAAKARNVSIGKIKIAFEPTGTFTTYGKNISTMTIGICLGSSKQVYLAESFFSGGMPVIQKKDLVFHELGHCLLGRQHNDTIIDQLHWHGGFEYSAPASIMGSRMWDFQSAYGYATMEFKEQNWNSYLNELFYNDLSYMAGFGVFHYATGGSSKPQSGNEYRNYVERDDVIID